MAIGSAKTKFLSDRPGVGVDPFFQRLSLRGWSQIVLAVFFMFAPLWAILTSEMVVGERYVPFIIWCCFGGLVGALYCLSVARHPKWLFAAIPATVFIAVGGWVSESNQWWLSPSIGLPIPTVEGVFTLICLVVAYFMFSRFIGSAGLEQARMRASLDLAKSIHDELVPDINARIGPFEVLGVATPSEEVGGDLVAMFESKHGADIVLGDVTGHGVRSGVVMAMAKSAFFTARLTEPQLPGVFERVNAAMHELTQTGMFVTAATLRLGHDGSASACLAGHLPLLWMCARTGEIRRIENDALPLGILPECSFPLEDLALTPGDLLAIVTDGLIEVAGPDGRQLGLEGVEAVLKRHRNESLPVIRDAIMAAAEQKGDVLDDRSIVLVRVGEAP